MRAAATPVAIHITPAAQAPRRLGLVLSGGGVRALVFHLGVLDRLARDRLVEEVGNLSTVSGGSLCAGLVYRFNEFCWPDSAQFRSTVLPACKELLTTKNVEREYITRVLFQPWQLLRGRAALLAEVLRLRWGITKNLSELFHPGQPLRPRWFINATTYETGKEWRFDGKRMGDYWTGYVDNPDFPLAEAMAASAAVPGLIGPLQFDTRKYSWSQFPGPNGVAAPTQPPFKTLHLWDGGVYDNLGLEPLCNFGQETAERAKFKRGIEFLLVSDASRPVDAVEDRRGLGGLFYRPAMRLVDIATDQVRALRARDIVDHFKAHPETGAYLMLGNTAAAIFAKAEISPPSVGTSTSLDAAAVEQVQHFPTTLRRLTKDEYDLLLRHGYEVADATLAAYNPEGFGHVPF